MLVLTIVTFGVYRFVWYYTIHRELQDFDTRTGAQPGGSLLAVTIGALALVPPFVSILCRGQRMRAAQRLAGGGPTRLGAAYYQSELNQVWARYGSPPPGTRPDRNRTVSRRP